MSVISIARSNESNDFLSLLQLVVTLEKGGERERGTEEDSGYSHTDCHDSADMMPKMEARLCGATPTQIANMPSLVVSSMTPLCPASCPMGSSGSNLFIA